MLLERRHRPVRGIRVVRRPGAPFRAQIVPMRRVSGDDIRSVLDAIEPTIDDGMIVTSAMSPVEQRPFREVGFELLEELHLLRHSLQAAPDVNSDAAIRSARRSDLDDVLRIDSRSFDEFWTLDRPGLIAARRATSSHRYVVATLDEAVVGYAVTGAAGASSFLQRLAVDPTVRGERIGAHLVRDAVEWAKRRRAASMLVNTQISNQRAFDLYQQLGFEVDRERLAVLRWPG